MAKRKNKRKKTKTKEQLEFLEIRRKKFETLLNLIKCEEVRWVAREKVLGEFFGFHPSTLRNVRTCRTNLSDKSTDKIKRVLKEKRGIDESVLDFLILEEGAFV